jgi:hypothetical protein
MRDQVPDDFHRPPVVRKPDRCVRNPFHNRSGVRRRQVHQCANQLGFGIPLFGYAFGASGRGFGVIVGSCDERQRAVLCRFDCHHAAPSVRSAMRSGRKPLQ